MFEEIIDKTLDHEGYYANVAGDNGGETYRGISRRFHPDWEGWSIVDQAKTNAGGWLPNNFKVPGILLEGMVLNFYKANFWDKILLDRVTNVNLQGIIFDAFVNSGKNGIILLQRILTAWGQKLSIDGAMGPITVVAINAVDPKRLFDAYKRSREQYYRSIATGTNQKFLSGWLNRIQSFNYKVVGVSLAGVLLLGLAGFFL